MSKLVPEFIQVLPRAFIAQAAFLGYWQESFASRFQRCGSRLISICDTVQFVTDLSYAPWSAGIWATTSEAQSGLARLGITSVLSLVFTDSTPSSVLVAVLWVNFYVAISIWIVVLFISRTHTYVRILMFYLY
jgi:hypothetical protein